jgi:uncharacterized protein (TIGR02145 family)
MMKNLALLFLATFISINLLAQTNMYIRKTDGSMLSLPVSTIDSIFYVNTVAEPVSDFDGNSYDAVQIGNQIWMKTNLKTTHYADGTAINLISDNTTWAALADNNTDASMCYYNNNASNEVATYGALYSWAAAMKGSTTEATQGVCPTGWHLPSDTEITELITFLGGSDLSGGKLKESGTTHWTTPNEGATNESYFTGLGAGYRRYDTGVSENTKKISYLWSSTSSTETTALSLKLSYLTATTNQIAFNKSLGASVRCVKN